MSLKFVDTIKVDCMADNITIDESGDVYIAGATNPLLALLNFNDPSFKSPSAVLLFLTQAQRIRMNPGNGKKFKVTTIYSDNGEDVSCATTAMVDRKNNISIITGIFTPGVIVCKSAL
jgi:hypothetical protein